MWFCSLHQYKPWWIWEDFKGQVQRLPLHYFWSDVCQPAGVSLRRQVFLFCFSAAKNHLTFLSMTGAWPWQWRGLGLPFLTPNSIQVLITLLRTLCFPPIRGNTAWIWTITALLYSVNSFIPEGVFCGSCKLEFRSSQAKTRFLWAIPWILLIHLFSESWHAEVWADLVDNGQRGTGNSRGKPILNNASKTLTWCAFWHFILMFVEYYYLMESSIRLKHYKDRNCLSCPML